MDQFPTADNLRTMANNYNSLDCFCERVLAPLLVETAQSGLYKINVEPKRFPEFFDYEALAQLMEEKGIRMYIDTLSHAHHDGLGKSTQFRGVILSWNPLSPPPPPSIWTVVERRDHKRLCPDPIPTDTKQ
jgi:hypothetical protein